jgi:hypothetical protein
MWEERYSIANSTLGDLDGVLVYPEDDPYVTTVQRLSDHRKQFLENAHVATYARLVGTESLTNGGRGYLGDEQVLQQLPHIINFQLEDMLDLQTSFDGMRAIFEGWKEYGVLLELAQSGDIHSADVRKGISPHTSSNKRLSRDSLLTLIHPKAEEMVRKLWGGGETPMK